MASEVAARIRSALSPAIRVHGAASAITASVGIALPQPGSDLDDVLGRADHAMYQAKAVGKDTHEFFAAQRLPLMRRGGLTRQSMVNDGR